MSLLNKLRNTVAATTLGLSVACAPYLTNNNMLYGNRLSNVSSDHGKYILPLVTIAGLELNPQRPTKIPKEGEKDIIFKPYGVEGSDLVKDRTSGRFDLETKTVFVVRPYIKTGTVPVKEFELDIRAVIGSSRGSDARRLGVREVRHGDMTYDIPTIKIDINPDKKGKEECYAVAEKDANGKITQRIIFEVEGTQEVVDTKSGKLILRRNDELNHLVEMPIAEYTTGREDKPVREQEDEPGNDTSTGNAK